MKIEPSEEKYEKRCEREEKILFYGQIEIYIFVADYERNDSEGFASNFKGWKFTKYESFQ